MGAYTDKKLKKGFLKIWVILYETDEGKINVDVILKDETIWLTQKSMSELFELWLKDL